MDIYYDDDADKILIGARRVLYADTVFAEGTYGGTYKLADGRYVERHIMISTQKIYVMTPFEYSEQLREKVTRALSHASP